MQVCSGFNSHTSLAVNPNLRMERFVLTDALCARMVSLCFGKLSTDRSFAAMVHPAAAGINSQ